MEFFKQGRLVASLSFILFMLVAPPPSEAISLKSLKCNLLLSNRQYRDGEVVKSPMKSDPMLVRLKKNVMFKFGMINYPIRDLLERTPDFFSDYEFLNERRYDNRLGKTHTFYDPEFDTRFYHSLTGKALPDGTMPVIDPESKGLFIYIHGSGTNKAGGVNFAYKATEISRYGYSTLSFDLPFHADGSQNGKIANTERFMAMLDTIVKKYRVPGKPVYLAGHSFGPEIVFEYIKRYPHGVDGVVALSPAAFNQDLNDWFMKITSQASAFWGDTRPNDLGGIWGGQATSESQWNNPKSNLPDPTRANPNLKVVTLTGDWEEYAPGPLKENGEPAKESRTYDICGSLLKLMGGLYCVREPRVGHYIFTHKDDFGNDVVLRELFRVTQSSRAAMDAFPAKMASELKAMKAETDARAVAETDKLALRYTREPFFKKWLNESQGGIERIRRLIAENDQKTALTLQKKFNLVLQQRERALMENIAKSQTTLPDFYRENQSAIETYIQSNGKVGGDALMGRYFDYLNLNPTHYSSQMRASTSVLDIPADYGIEEPKRPKVEGSVTLHDGITSLTLASGESFSFNAEIPPQSEEVAFSVQAIKELRAAKKHLEAQVVSDWLKRWVEIKFNKDRSLESWKYTASSTAEL